MNIRNWLILLLGVLLALLLVANVLAMSSNNYSLDWYVPVTGTSGGESSSVKYKINMTVGQSVIGPSTSNSYSSGLGYWYGLLLDRIRILPIVFK